MTSPAECWNLGRGRHRAETGIVAMVDVVVERRATPVAIVATKALLPMNVAGKVFLGDNQVLRFFIAGQRARLTVAKHAGILLGQRFA